MYAHIFYNTDRLDQFPERHNLTVLTQKVDSLYRSMSIKEIESVINNLPIQKEATPDGFTGEFYWTFKGEVVPIFHNLF